MNEVSAIIYGLIQGLSEFLPVSSSGHLAILPHVMKISDPGVIFDLMMHLGTALAVIVYFFKDILAMTKALIPAFLDWKKQGSDYFFVRNFVISTFCTVVVILIIKDFALSFGRTPKLIAINLMVFGGLLYLSDRRKGAEIAPLDSPMKMGVDWPRAILIGVSQALAIFPGVSRSGITMTAGRFMNLDRHQASSYSFLLSLPIILAGVIYEVPKYMKAQSDVSSSVLLVGVAVAFLVGILTIHYFLKMIRKIGMGVFFAYRVLLGIIILFLIS